MPGEQRAQSDAVYAVDLVHRMPWAKGTPVGCWLQDVYAEDLVHRMPGDTSTMAPLERAFEHLAAQWVEAETCSGAAASPDLEPDHDLEVHVSSKLAPCGKSNCAAFPRGLDLGIRS